MGLIAPKTSHESTQWILPGTFVANRSLTYPETIKTTKWISWDLIDVIVISNFELAGALPFVTEYTSFEGAVYATLPTIEFSK
jgi:Cft2 family RNA processing exonuclease